MSKNLTLSQFCYHLLTLPVGLAYLLNAPNFGKSVVGLWGAAAIALSVALLCALLLPGRSARRSLALYGGAAAVAMQLPPLVCWAKFAAQSFQVFSLMVPGLGGLAVHGLLAVWGAANVVCLRRAWAA